MGKSSKVTMAEIKRDLLDIENNRDSDQTRVSFNELVDAIKETAGEDPRTIINYINYLQKRNHIKEKELEEVNGHAFVIR